MENTKWKITTKNDDDIKLTIKEANDFFIAEISTHICVPISRLNDVICTIEVAKESLYDGTIISFEPFENGKLSLYCGMNEKEKEETLESGIANLKALKSLIELSILEV